MLFSSTTRSNARARSAVFTTAKPPVSFETRRRFSCERRSSWLSPDAPSPFVGSSAGLVSCMVSSPNPRRPRASTP